MSLPASWVERLFARLRARYGVAFDRQYDGVQAEAVRADWALAMDDFQRHPRAIEWALANLPETAPNASQFLRLCRSCPGEEREQPKALPAPKADPRRVRELLGELAQRIKARQASGAQATAERLRAIEAEGKPLTLAQREILSACEREDQPSALTIPGNAIPRENWPWVQRGESR